MDCKHRTFFVDTIHRNVLLSNFCDIDYIIRFLTPNGTQQNSIIQLTWEKRMDSPTLCAYSYISGRERTTNNQLLADLDHSFHPSTCVAYLQKISSRACILRCSLHILVNVQHVWKPDTTMSTMTWLSTVFEICCVLSVTDFTQTIHRVRKKWEQ